MEGISSEERREFIELRQLNRVLETDVEIFKRASAYFEGEKVVLASAISVMRILPVRYATYTTVPP